MSTSIQTLKGLQQGGKRALSEALGKIEQSLDDLAVLKLLDDAFDQPVAHVVGFTGPPGVGKSTLINSLIQNWRSRGKTVGVIAVDPSSHVSGGALLGDRTRMMTDPEDKGVFVRSLAARGQLGGLSALAFPTLVLMRALFDVVIIETVGVGQSEAEITSHADTVVLCVQPGSGDSLQFMKSGIMEIPDVAVVTKADMGAAATRALADLKGALSITHSGQGERLKVLSVSAVQKNGLDELVAAVEAHYQELLAGACASVPDLKTGRARQAKAWFKASIAKDYGLLGFELVENSLNFDEVGPFQLLDSMRKRLTVKLDS